MKLFYFNPNTYGNEAIVMAEDVEEAKQKLLNSKCDRSGDEWSVDYDNRMIQQMVTAPMGPLPRDKYGNTIGEHYTIDEMTDGIVFTEIS